MQINGFFSKYSRRFKTPTSVLFWLLLIFAFEAPREGCLTVLAAFIHETGHFIYTLIFLRSPSAPYGALSGLRIRKRGIMSYGQETMLYLSGPFANLVVCILLLPCFSAASGFFGDLAVVNIFTMLFNLLPIEGYDGYGAILAVAGALGKEMQVRSVLRYASFFLTLIMLLISLYLMYYLNGGYWIYAIFSVSALSFINKALKTQKQRF